MKTVRRFFSNYIQAKLPRQSQALSAPLLPGTSVALTAIALNELYPARFTVVVTASPLEQEHIYEDLCTLTATTVMLPFLLTTEQSTTTEDQSALELAQKLQTPQARQPLIVVASLASFLCPLPDLQAIAQATIKITLGDELSFDNLIETLVKNGFTRVAEVSEPGELAVRGGLLDLWAPLTTSPWRIEFFGSQVESIRAFDPITQLSVSHASEVTLAPCPESLPQGLELARLLPKGATLIWLEHDALAQATPLIQRSARSAKITWEKLQACIRQREPAFQLFCGDPPPPHMPALPLDIGIVPGISAAGDGDTHHLELMLQARQRLINDLESRAQSGEQVWLCLDTPGVCTLITRELAPDTTILVKQARLSGGFSIAGLTLVTQSDLYATRKQSVRRTTHATPQGAPVEQISELTPGDLVVHIDHGVGRYLGTTEIESDHRRIEVLTLEYADGAKLHVPLTHAHLLSRYVGMAGKRAKLHRLGGHSWSRDKAQATKAVEDLAASLLDTQAQREVVSGYAFDVTPPWLQEFVASFPYQETVDQERVIAEIKHDMQNPRPMDRLICGDAGYGKTEVAMRAAFIAVMNAKQVAVLVPTTVLAEQHYETFCERMAGYGIKLAVVSRFHTPAQCERALAGAAAGTIDIIIGTHALLSPKVAFKDLGLLIIDEEQRFGVKHKEQLKHVRQLVDILTLSATPIPRTLYMSMTGARDMSLLQTPPHNRVAVETKVVRDSDNAIRNAILKELHRNGQVYFLYNRVLTINFMLRRLQRLVPEATIVVAHGQMPSRELAQVMRDFETGIIDVLLCTTIVESGLDIPRANTIIIHRADRFGIADLYQLRGRVGRSALKGFAWLLLPDYGHIDPDARQRINALQKHSGLRAGFHLALRDLEIRGAGNLLGAAQSGHIVAIGFNLYCQLLQRTVARLKGKTPPKLILVDLDLDFIKLSPGLIDDERTAALPYYYIEEETQRIALHRRIAEAATLTAIKALQREAIDRYGQAPPAAKRLFQLTELRIIAARKGLQSVKTRRNKVYLYRVNQQIELLANQRLPTLRGTTCDEQLNALLKIIKALP